MKKRILLAIVMIVGYSVSIMAQTTATESNNATCTIIAPISISAGADLAFGTVIKGAGTVVVATDDARTIDAAMKVGSGLQVGTVTAAQFTVSGEQDYTYAITLPSAAVEIIHGTDVMDVTAFNCVSGTTSATDGTGKLGGALGTDVIKVGATLTVAADQASGYYTSTFDVTVAYN